MATLTEYDIEPIRGLPGPLPAGERLLWQGTPSWQGLARRTFHIRVVAVYFALLMAWRAGSALSDGQSLSAALSYAFGLLPVAAAALGLLALLAWGYCRATVYTITSRRVVIRSGVALQVIVNFPFTTIKAAALKTYADGSGDIPLVLDSKQRVSYMLLWPNVRPWKLRHPQPMLRAVPHVAPVAELLAQALAEQTPAAAAHANADTAGAGRAFTPATSAPM